MPNSDTNTKEFNEIDDMYIEWYLDDPKKFQDLSEEHKKAVDESFNRLFQPLESVI